MQEGEDTEGILGFMNDDIRAEIDRAQKVVRNNDISNFQSFVHVCFFIYKICSYCRRPGANIGCCHSHCRQSFHLPCAVENKCLSDFKKTFKSFCRKHSTLFAVPPSEQHSINDACRICLDDMGEYDPVDSIRSPCCSQDVWYHKRCMMQTAKAAGYFFNCPLCKNSEEFREHMTAHGVFIPDADAAWEHAPNAFEEVHNP